MKNIFLLSMVLCGIAINSIAQVKVFSNGNVGIQAGTTAPTSALAVGTSTAQEAIRVQTNNNGLLIYRTGTRPFASWNYLSLFQNDLVDGNSIYAVALSGKSMYATAANAGGRAWGVMGVAGYATSGYNYGVMGVLSGDIKHFGAGIVGTVDGNTDVNVPGRFAGYFAGDVKITTQLMVNTTTYSSDLRYKQNIVDLGSFSTERTGNGILQSVLSMNPIQYNIRQLYSASAGDTAGIKTAMYNERSQIFTKKHYGLIAQELQTLYPDLVYQGEDGYLSVDYIGIIPLLIQSIKELKSEIDNSKNIAIGADVSVAPAKAPAGPTNIDNTDAMVSALFQNTPNPFSQATEIRYFLPATVNNALLCIYDLNGRQLKQIPLTRRGSGSQIISGAEFAAGIYLYALIADGKEVDVKRMILTE
jgi:hypothetical protein